MRAGGPARRPSRPPRRAAAGRTAAPPRPWTPPPPARRGPGACLRPAPVSPARTSSPARRISLPAGSGAATRSRPSACSASSTRSTASAPAGTIAPVEMTVASPGPSVPSYGRPARDSPTRLSSTGAAGPAPRDVRGAQRESVHRRVVEARHVVRARDVACEHAAVRVGQRDGFELRSRSALEHRGRQPRAGRAGRLSPAQAARDGVQRSQRQPSADLQRQLHRLGGAVDREPRQAGCAVLAAGSRLGSLARLSRRAAGSRPVASAQRACVRSPWPVRRALVAAAEVLRLRALARWGAALRKPAHDVRRAVAAAWRGIPSRGSRPAWPSPACSAPWAGSCGWSPIGLDCWSRSTLCLPVVSGADSANACGAYCYPIRLELDTCGFGNRRVQASSVRVQQGSFAFPGEKCPKSATFALETRINK